MKKLQRNYYKTVPMRLFKCSVGVLLAIPIYMVAFAVHCYKTNKFPWDATL